MRFLIAVPALVALGACNVSKEGNAVTVQYDQNTAENTAADVGNAAENIGGLIVNDVERTGDKLKNADVDVSVNRDAQANNTNQH